jgi:adenylate cyclase
MQEYAHWTLGVIQDILGNQDLAIAELKRSIEINPNFSIAYGTLGIKN